MIIVDGFQTSTHPTRTRGGIRRSGFQRHPAPHPSRKSPGRSDVLRCRPSDARMRNARDDPAVDPVQASGSATIGS